MFHSWTHGAQGGAGGWQVIQLLCHKENHVEDLEGILPKPTLPFKVAHVVINPEVAAGQTGSGGQSRGRGERARKCDPIRKWETIRGVPVCGCGHEGGWADPKAANMVSQKEGGSQDRHTICIPVPAQDENVGPFQSHHEFQHRDGRVVGPLWPQAMDCTGFGPHRL